MPNTTAVRLRRTAAALLVVLTTAQATGCTSWQAVPQPWPAEFRPGRTDTRIRVELTTGSKIMADSGRATPDSLVAYDGTFTQFVPWSMVRKVEIRRFDALKSVPVFLGVGLVAAGAVAAGSVGGTIGGGGGGCSYFCGTSSVAPPPELR